jgi:hypothetical protein
LMLPMLAGSKHPLLLAREHWQPLAFCKLQLASMPMWQKKKSRNLRSADKASYAYIH